MELYLDVDGVILDFEGSFVDFVRDEYLPDLPADYILQTWEVSDEFKELDIAMVWQRFVTSERFSRMRLLIDAEDFNQLSSRYPLYLITNIPNAQYDSRVINLNHHGLAYTGLYLAGHFNFGDEAYPSKSQIINELHNPEHSLVFLDDHPKNCQDVKEHFPESFVYLMERPHNKKVDDGTWVRVRNWKEFGEQVAAIDRC